jgi:hypothetical protein
MRPAFSSVRVCADDLMPGSNQPWKKVSTYGAGSAGYQDSHDTASKTLTAPTRCPFCPYMMLIAVESSDYVSSLTRRSGRREFCLPRQRAMIPVSRPPAEPGRNKGMSQTSAKRAKLAGCPCRIVEGLHGSARELALAVLGPPMLLHIFGLTAAEL